MRYLKEWTIYSFIRSKNIFFLFLSILNHRTKFEHRKKCPISSNPNTSVERTSARFYHDNTAYYECKWDKNNQKYQTDNNIKNPLNNTSPGCNTDSSYFNKRYPPNKINIRILFCSLIEISDIPIAHTIDLAVLKEIFFDLIREIMREDNDILNTIFLNNFRMLTDST